MHTTIPAAEIRPDMTLVIDGQHHVVEEATQHEDGGLVYVQAETVVGDMGPRAFSFEPADCVTILA